MGTTKEVHRSHESRSLLLFLNVMDFFFPFSPPFFYVHYERFLDNNLIKLVGIEQEFVFSLGMLINPGKIIEISIINFHNIHEICFINGVCGDKVISLFSSHDEEQHAMSIT